jgi:predicted Zn finger-like uncharacterized protein
VTEHITRCPKCSTSFKVKEAHLNTARGAVRCGSCLAVFNAREHLIATKKTESPEPTHSALPTASTPTPSATVAHDDDDDLLIDDDMPGEDGSDIDDDFGTNVFISKTSKNVDTNLFERTDTGLQGDDDESSNQDESWALNLLNDDDSSSSKLDQSEPEEEAFFAPGYGEEEVSKEDEADDNPFEFEPSEEPASNTGAFQIIEDDEPEEALDDSPFQERERSKKPYDEDYDEYFDGREEVVYETGNSSYDYLESFEPEPVEVHVKHRRPVHELPFFWGSLSLLAAIIAFTQFAMFRFDDLSRHTSFRPYYASACNVLGCELPELRDLGKIKVVNILVSENKSQPGTLRVQAVLVNRANYEQAFPALQLEFSNTRNSIIVEHRFAPKDYVGGEIAGATMMPSHRPVQISLEVEDPGEAASNYQLSLIKD